MAQTMTDKFSSIADFFAFDKKKYTMEDFFTDVNTFINQFQVQNKKMCKPLIKFGYKVEFGILPCNLLCRLQHCSSASSLPSH